MKQASFFKCVKVITLFKTKANNMHAHAPTKPDGHTAYTTSCAELEVLNTSQGPQWDLRGVDPSGSSSSRLSALSSSALSANIINNLGEEERRTTVTPLDLWQSLSI